MEATFTPLNVGPGQATCTRCGLTFPTREIAALHEHCPNCKGRNTIELIRRMPRKAQTAKQLNIFGGDAIATATLEQERKERA